MRSLLILLPILLWYIPSFIISSLNYSHYGYWGITEQLDPDFDRILSTLSRIKTVGAWHPSIQITKEARMKAYEVSPILYAIKDQIEAYVDAYNPWDDQSMANKPAWFLSQYGNGGGQIGVHFLWLLRDLVASQGYYSNGKYPQDFYKQIADQLEAACDDGRLDCSPPNKIPFIGSIDRRHYPIILRMFYDGSLNLLKQNYPTYVGIPSLDIRTWPGWPENNDEYKYFEEFVYNSINGPGIPSDHDAQYFVDVKKDLRVKILSYKERTMVSIVSLYKELTLPAFIISFIGWIFLLIFSISKKRWATQESFLIVSVFTMGLFISRLMTLAIVDATTSMAAVEVYGASVYLFVYVFSILMVYWIFIQAINIILARKK